MLLPTACMNLKQAKYGDALEILSGKLGPLLVIEVDKLRVQGRLLAQSGDYAAGASVYQNILELCPDDWECFLHYLGCMLEDDSSWSSGADNNPVHYPKFLDCKVSHLADDVFDSRLSDASIFVQKLLVDANNGFVRCPHLAILEIERRRHLYGKANDDEIMEALMQYFYKFGHLACFTSDVEVFLLILTTEKRMEFVEKLTKCSNTLSTIPAKVLGQSITVFKIQLLVGNIDKLPVVELEGFARQMVEIFWKSIPLAKDLDPQESMHGEELLSMICNVLVQLFWRTGHFGYFMEAIMVLEFGLTIRRFVWQYKILLLHLYSHLGAVSLAYERYKSMDVKNILTETISHHILPHMLPSPLWVDSSNLLQDYLRFMDDHFRESADLTFLAYRHRNYSKVIEFVQFKERLQRSNQYLNAKVETSILQLKQRADNIEEEEGILDSLDSGIYFVELSNEIRSKNLTFNEDFQTRPWWTPAPEKNYLLGPFEGISYYPKENMTKEREENVRRVIEKKSLLPRMIYLSIQSTTVSYKENGSISESKISSELKFLLERYAKMLGYSLTDAIEVVMGASTGLKSSEAFGSDTIDWLNFSVFLNAWNLNSHELSHPDDDRGGRGIWHNVDTLLAMYILEKTRSMGSLISSPRGDLPVLVQLITEPLAWHGLVLQSCVRASLPSGKKKKKSGPTEHSTSLLCGIIQDSINSSAGIVEEVAKWIQEQINKAEDEVVDNILSSLGKKEQDEGPGQVFHLLEKFTSSIDEVQLGSRISQALNLWSPVDVARKIVIGNSTVLSEFLRICESKIKLLHKLKHQIAQV
ncbi:N-terminal acetyltransferase B complex auxiliary subunit NAA25 isoform X2 [Mercurialis annua]|uniref:N-terminal acetyltransferase B complex auxiliary subunit NAA25 isoform X2 n=1 Tax=Mercurialis annua TaxID=3986 RepID=UPI00216058AB|nr:N-terminal acetyltransferase B complex auxiliary subunit NAA25 isoform X2 [Mercurialis annua]